MKVLLLDVGGVLLSNGWDRALRKKAAETFGLNFEQMQHLHDMVFEDYERGYLSLKDYIKHIAFFKPQAFTMTQFQDFMFQQVQPNLPLMQVVEGFKRRHAVKVALLSNEGKELAVDRFQKFPFFQRCIDSYIVSGFVKMRKPDLRMYELALGVMQADPDSILFIDDRQKNLVPANAMGMHTLQHIDNATTCAALERW